MRIDNAIKHSTRSSALRLPVVLARLTLALAGSAACTAAAYAGGIGVPEQDTFAVAESTGGETTGAQPSTSYYNPAGMVLIDGNEFEGDITLFDIHSRVNSTLIPDPQAPPGPNLTGHATNFLETTAVATTFGVLSLPHGIKLGFDITQPNGGRIKYPSNFLGNYEGDEALLTSIQGGLSIAVPITDQLSVGGGPVIDYFQSILGVVQNIPVGAGLTPNGDGAIGHFSGKSYSVGYNAGAMYQFNADTRIGVDYRSKITHDIKGVERIDSGALSALLGPLGAAPVSSASDKFVFPQTVSFGVFHRINAEWAVMGNAQWENWHTYQMLYINDPTTAKTFMVGPNISPIVTNFRFRNAWTVGIATTYTPIPLPKLTLMGGLGYDETPVPSGNYRVTALPDNNRVLLGFGGTYQVTPRLAVQGAYAHYFIQDSGINDRRLAANGATSYAGTLVGEYKISADVFSIGLNAKF